MTDPEAPLSKRGRLYLLHRTDRGGSRGGVAAGGEDGSRRERWRTVAADSGELRPVQAAGRVCCSTVLRRGLQSLLALAALAILAGCGGASKGGTPVSLILDFTPNAVHAGIYSAVAHHYDRAAGVAIHVEVPSNSTDSVELLLGGRADFAVLDIHDLAIARAQGRDIVGVMALEQHPLAAVIAQPSIGGPRALAGRLVGVSGLPSDIAVLRSVVSGAGGNPAKVDRITIGFDAVPALLSGRVAAATAFWNVEGVELARQRFGMHAFRVDDYGAPAYPELVLCVARATLVHRPSLVRSVVGALTRGYRLMIEHPQASLQDLLSRTQGLDPALLRAEVRAIEPALAPADGRFGELDPTRLAAWSRWEARFGIVSSPPDVHAAFDGRFLP